MTTTTTTPPAIDLTKPLLLTSSTPHLDTLIRGIVHIHAHCILHDGQLATFLPPLSHNKILKFWQTNLRQVGAGERRIIVKLLKVDERSIPENDASIVPLVYAADSVGVVSIPVLEIDGERWEVAGVVSLYEPWSETGPMRGLVEKLFTSPFHRRKGVARIVMEELERIAREDGRWNLLLDTTVGTDAEHVYPRLGYSRAGLVKQYGVHPKTGQYVDEVWFCKDLR